MPTLWSAAKSSRILSIIWNKEEKLDEFVDTMVKIAQEAQNNPEKILTAPHTTPVKKIDEVTAARHPDLKYIS